MNRPKTVKVGGHNYKVLWPYKFQERDDVSGQCDYVLNELRIAEVDGSGNERAISSQTVSFIHELLHAIDIASGHKVFINNEPAIEGISEGIYQVLVDNGWLPKDN